MRLRRKEEPEDERSTRQLVLQLNRKIDDQMASIDALTVAVANNTAATEAAVAKILGGKPTQAEVDTITTAIEKNTTELQTAVAPPKPAGPTQSVYLFTGTGQPDLTKWSIAPFHTADPQARQLYFYSGDKANSTETNGVGIAGWELYAGAVTAQ